MLLVSSILVNSLSAFGAEKSTKLITPSSSICCKNETSFSTQSPPSTSETTPLKKISTQDKKPQDQSDETNTKKSSNAFDPLSNTDTTSTSTSNHADHLSRMDENSNEGSAFSFPTPITAYPSDDNEDSNLSNDIRNNLNKLLQADLATKSISDDTTSDDTTSDDTTSDDTTSDDSDPQLAELRSMMSEVFS
jgi:hypothetical protein